MALACAGGFSAPAILGTSNTRSDFHGGKVLGRLALRDFGVVLFSSQPPRETARLAERIAREVAGARVLGILYEQCLPRSLGENLRSLRRNLADPAYYPYAAARTLRLLRRPLDKLGEALLRFAHACPPRLNGSTDFGLEDLAQFSRRMGCSLLVTTDIHSPKALEYVRQLRADLGIVSGTRLLKQELFDVPRLGSVKVHPHKLPDCRGAGPAGLWELLDGRKEIGVTVHRVVAELDAGPILRAATTPIDAYDDLFSLALKATVVGNDLLLCTLADFISGTVQETPQSGTARTFRAPAAHELARYKRQLAKRRPTYRPPRTRPAWKLMLRTVPLVAVAVARNWICRFRKSFPVVILYHHLITDRPHHLGLPTHLFHRQAEFLTKYYRVASVQEAIKMLEANCVEAPTVVLTFDDGYAENFVNLRAVAKATGIPVTLFVSTEHISTQRPFAHDIRKNQQGFPPLTWEQVGWMNCAGFEFGGHTRSHFDCGSTDLAALEYEIVGCKTDLEERLGKPVRIFSFPWGMPENMSRPAVELARATFAYIFDAAGGANVPSAQHTPWFLRRCDHPGTLWELELLLQCLLDLRRSGSLLPAMVRQLARS